MDQSEMIMKIELKMDDNNKEQVIAAVGELKKACLHNLKGGEEMVKDRWSDKEVVLAAVNHEGFKLGDAPK